MGRLNELSVSIYCLPTDNKGQQEEIIQQFRSAADALSSIEWVRFDEFFSDFIDKTIEALHSSFFHLESDDCSFAINSSDHFGNQRPYDFDFLDRYTRYTLHSDTQRLADVCEGREAVEYVLEGFEAMVESGFFKEDSGIYSTRDMLRKYLSGPGEEWSLVIFSSVEC